MREPTKRECGDRTSISGCSQEIVVQAILPLKESSVGTADLLLLTLL